MPAGAAGTAVFVTAAVLAAIFAEFLSALLSVLLSALLFALLLALLSALLAAFLGATLRAIGRGFGNGILDLSEASVSHARESRAIASVVTMAVDRNEAARVERITAFLCDESRDSSRPERNGFDIRHPPGRKLVKRERRIPNSTSILNLLEVF